MMLACGLVMVEPWGFLGAFLSLVMLLPCVLF